MSSQTIWTRAATIHFAQATSCTRAKRLYLVNDVVVSIDEIDELSSMLNSGVDPEQVLAGWLRHLPGRTELI
jgi:hypothetical protein